MEELLAARRIMYFHFIQPNQYYPTKRRFSEEEKKIAFNESNAANDVIPQGYARLLARLGSLQQSGVRVLSEANVFDDSTDIVYIDDCCHYTQNGHRIFAAQVAQNINKLLTDETAPKQ